MALASAPDSLRFRSICAIANTAATVSPATMVFAMVLAFGLHLAAIRNYLAGNNLRIEGHHLVAGGAEYDVMPAGRERQRRGSWGELGDAANFRTVDDDARSARRDLEAHAAGVLPLLRRRRS